MKLYTKTGDKGETSLFGGQRVEKDHARVAAYGEVDELNSYLGVVRLYLNDFKNEDQVINRIQKELFKMGADLATPADSRGSHQIERLTEQDYQWLESAIDTYQDQCPPFRFFVLPGGSAMSAHLHVARTLCRRAERYVVTLSKETAGLDFIIIYLNRLADLLFIMARYLNIQSGVKEEEWKTDN